MSRSPPPARPAVGFCHTAFHRCAHLRPPSHPGTKCSRCHPPGSGHLDDRNNAGPADGLYPQVRTSRSCRPLLSCSHSIRRTRDQSCAASAYNLRRRRKRNPASPKTSHQHFKRMPKPARANHCHRRRSSSPSCHIKPSCGHCGTGLWTNRN